MESTSTRIVVSSNRQWVLAGGGNVVIYVDGAKVGVLPPVGRLELPCSPGSHQVRIRQGWLTSRNSSVSVTANSCALVTLCDPSQSPFFKTWLRMMFTPWKSLSIAVENYDPFSPEDPTAALVSLIEVSETRHQILLSAALQVIGFAFLLVAVIAHSWALVAISFVVVFFGFGIGIKLMIVQRR